MYITVFIVSVIKILYLEPVSVDTNIMEYISLQTVYPCLHLAHEFYSYVEQDIGTYKLYGFCPHCDKGLSGQILFCFYVFNISYYQSLYQVEQFLSHSHSVLSL